MFEIFKSELARYQKWAWLWALFLFAAFGFITKQKPLLDHHIAQSLFNNLVLIGGAFVFGILQMALHKRKSHWTFLIHRPIKLSRIYLGLFAVGATTIFIAAIFPWLVATIGIDIGQTEIVDARHYAYPVYLFLTCLLAYQIGQFIILNASWGALCLASMLVVALAPVANSPLAQYGPVVLFNLVMLYLNLSSFKPDLSTYLKKPLDVALIALPMSLCISVLLMVVTTMFYHLPNFVLGSHADNNPPKDSVNQIYFTKKEDAFGFLLEDSNHPLKDSIVAQSELADTISFSLYNNKKGRLQQLYVDDVGSQLADNENETFWDFSHDLGLIVPKDSLKNPNSPAIGRRGFIESAKAATELDRFQQVPWLAPNHYITDRELVWVDFKQGYTKVRFSLNEGEYFMTLPRQNNGYTYLVTNQRITLFTTQAYLDQYTPLTEIAQLPHPVSIENMWAARAMELPQGFAVMYYGLDYFGLDKPGAHVVLTTFDGEYSVIGVKQFSQLIYPDWVNNFDYLVSPVLYFSRSAIFDLLSVERGAVLRNTDPTNPFANYSTVINVSALVLHILSLIVGILLTRFHTLSSGLKALWVTLFFIMGLPAVISFLLLNPFKGVYKLSHRQQSNSLSSPLAEVTSN